MIFELIYTSYPRGLQSGTSGFTPVAYTEGMPRTYIQICESLSGYNFIYPLGHPLYDKNPEIYSHYIFYDNTQYHNDKISILSRIAAAGRDYTGRENKIAHHIIFDNEERLKFPLGPAFLMLYGDIFVQQWEKSPSILQPKIFKLPNSSVSNFGTHHFSSNSSNTALTLAKSATLNLTSSTGTPSFILFDPDDFKQNLKFLAEAFSFLKPENKWNITFNTYFISKPMDSHCFWRCCPKHSNIDKYTDSLVIDLTNNRVYGDIAIEKIAIIEKNQSLNNEGLTEAELNENSYLSDLSKKNFLHQMQIDNIKVNCNKEDIIKKDDNSDTQSKYKKRAFLSYSYLFLLSIVLVIVIGFLYSYVFHHYNIKSEQNLKSSNSETYFANTSETFNKQKNLKYNDKNIINNNTTTEEYNQTDKMQKRENAKDKKIVLNFYKDISKNIKTINGGISDFKNIKCLLLRKDGTEVEADIEAPITGDTPNWDILDHNTKEPAGNISIGEISIYDNSLYSGLYLDTDSNEYSDLIWIAPIDTTRSIISKGKDANTIEIRFSSEVSNIVYKFLSLLDRNSLTGFIELNINKREKESKNSLDEVDNVVNKIDKIQDKLTFNPHINFNYIQLKFTDSDFKAVFKDNVSLDNGDKTSSSILKELEIKRLQIDYKNIQNNKIYPILEYIH